MSASAGGNGPREDARAARSGEELDGVAVDAWLKARLPHLRGTPQVTQYTGGASNWTYRLQYDNDDLILRRPPAGKKAKSAHDMGREFRIQRALMPVYPFVPEMYAHCEDESVIGAEFYVMQRLDGPILRKNLPRGLELSREQVRTLCMRVLDTLIALHQVDHRAAGLEQLAPGAGYTKRQIEGWSKRYRDARTWNVPSGGKIIDWLQANLPQDETICLTHNDFRFDNVVLDADDPTRVVGVLDWELATLGDPLMDVGNLLAYWVQADDDFLARDTRRQPTHLPGMFTRREVMDYYSERTGLRPRSWTFYEVYGLFRLSAIAQQIYYRYHHGQTRNPAFKRFWLSVNYLHWRCRRAIAGERG
ncbi:MULTISPECIES: phosphotransferase family protein [unclassified Lysobacter]|uniref:phosphotransferase family protein n=1 Tax=unclassified Lysobacter TaxID=2635362 RepID=UPI001BE86E52|nr:MULTISPECIES: phosphotransferase family protein [unclassified Lysobacter]MBT2747488.1 phosphotransferase family protein [Lysobacter sp. ISL-42]MBT2752734.1 phosphotransferase family protein [Lysobacter sp. ISL-50]MBT2778391.1 phosphotransferase family protein [Lysobacter sp. ISL-54]MBT2783909.1 phosphotransferase family protein [Lysobacter sp. ISL-52]